MAEVNLLRSCPRSRRRLAAPRSADPSNREAARRFGPEYFDGSREQGYGGYRYDGRWVPVARDIVEHFRLRPGARLLDVGCAKGFLLKDLLGASPGIEVVGLDISDYALAQAEPEVGGRLVRGTADRLPFPDGAFDAVVCVNVLHNLDRRRCRAALGEIERLAPGRGYVQVDAYRTAREREVFEQWALTALTYMAPEAWTSLFAEAGYRGDYYWTVLEADPEWNDFELGRRARP